jgi:predicted nuclease of predicted toxin-antitoxin system
MKFFVDNNLRPKLARGMAAFGDDVTHLQDHYPQDAKAPYQGACSMRPCDDDAI